MLYTNSGNSAIVVDAGTNGIAELRSVGRFKWQPDLRLYRRKKFGQTLYSETADLL